MAQAADKRWTAAGARAAFAKAPIVDLGSLCPDGSLLVVAPHPDDESLGCGGFIALTARAGCKVVVAALTDGEASHPNSRAYPPAALAQLRKSELRKAMTVLAGPAVRVETFGAPDGQLQAHEAQAQSWLANLGRPDPFQVVLATWDADPHPDHKAAFRIAARQAAQWGAALFAYPIWGLTLADKADAGPVAPCLRLDISAVLDLKRRAVAAHQSQTTGLIEDDPHGFRLSPADVSRHLGNFEVFIRVSAESWLGDRDAVGKVSSRQASDASAPYRVAGKAEAKDVGGADIADDAPGDRRL
jgi:LmbE family N-acetylglucosaminyl deacetylase